MSDQKSETRVTKHMPEPRVPVTKRLPEEEAAAPRPAVTVSVPESGNPEAPTAAAPPQAQAVPPPAAPAQAAPARKKGPIGAVVDKRWKIEKGPLGAPTGEAQVFLCRDLENNRPMALKLYMQQREPKGEIVKRLMGLDHPNLVGLRSWGVWAKRFYEVQDFCAGGDLTDVMPLTEDRIAPFLEQIAGGLQFCHSRGIVHRDIKPTNILFRDKARTQVALADFGISSVLQEGERDLVTRTYMNFTLAYASPEQLRLRQVGPASDYYSLGITIIHLLLGRSPFKGLAFHEIVDAHLSGRVPLPETSEWFAQMLKGLLRRDPDARWDFRRILAWVNGEPIAEETYYDRELPYPACPEARNPSQLARNLDRFDAAEELARGRLGLWLEYFDPDLAKAVADLATVVANAPAMALFRLRYVLDPDLPLKLGEHEIQDLKGLYDAALGMDLSLRAELLSAFWDGRLAVWIETAFRGERGIKLAELIRNFPKRPDAKRAMGLWPLILMLEPSTPMALTTKLQLRSPKDLAVVLSKPQLDKATRGLLESGRLLIWYEFSFPERKQDLAFLRDIMKRYPREEERFLALRWRFHPKHPLEIDGKPFTDPKQVAAFIDAGPDNWRLGRDMLESGRLRAWLTASGRLPDPKPLDEVLKSEHFTEDGSLEAVLHMLDPDLPHPMLHCEWPFVDLGTVIKGESARVVVEFTNKGRGHLAGWIRMEGGWGEITALPVRIEGSVTRVAIEAKPPYHLKTPSDRRFELLIETNGGNMVFPVMYRVAGRQDNAQQPGLVTKWISKLFD